MADLTPPLELTLELVPAHGLAVTQEEGGVPRSVADARYLLRTEYDPTGLPPATAAALQGTAGTPGEANRFVTDQDPRLQAASAPTWADIQDKPLAFPPEAHSHAYASLTDIPATFTPAAHRHPWSELDGVPVAFPPEAHTHGVGDLEATGTPSSTTFYRGDGVWATPPSGGGSGGTVEWVDVLNKPATFPPAVHTHDYGTLTGIPATFTPAAHRHPWSELDAVPATFPPDAHTHAYGTLTGIPATFAPSAHRHPWSELDSVPVAFPPEAHTHDYGSLTGIPATFTPSAHTHPVTDLTDVAFYAAGNAGAALTVTWTAVRRQQTVTVNQTPATLTLAGLPDGGSLELFLTLGVASASLTWAVEAGRTLVHMSNGGAAPPVPAASGKVMSVLALRVGTVIYLYHTGANG